MNKIRMLVIAVALAVFALGLFACDDEEEDRGVCIADFGIIVECFDCWDEGDCDDAGHDWHANADSCSDLGYTNPSGNNCGYTN
jgi:hypothetical protein